MENLIPDLLAALTPGKRRTFLSVSQGFEPGDVLHLLRPLFGHKQGSALQVNGFCLSRETPNGPAYALRAYVRVSATEGTTYANRQAAHFEQDCQQERWLGGIQMYLLEIDITDYADCLALERTAEAVVETITPLAAPAAWRKAA